MCSYIAIFGFTDQSPSNSDYRYFEAMTKEQTVEFMGNLKVAKALCFSNECTLFDHGCGCASFDYIYYSRLTKTSRQVVETVFPAEFWTTPRSTSASQIANRNFSLEWQTSLSNFRKSLNSPKSAAFVSHQLFGSGSLIPRNVAIYGDATQTVCGASDYDCYWLPKSFPDMVLRIYCFI